MSPDRYVVRFADGFSWDQKGLGAATSGVRESSLLCYDGIPLLSRFVSFLPRPADPVSLTALEWVGLDALVLGRRGQRPCRAGSSKIFLLIMLLLPSFLSSSSSSVFRHFLFFASFLFRVSTKK